MNVPEVSPQGALDFIARAVQWVLENPTKVIAWRQIIDWWFKLAKPIIERHTLTRSATATAALIQLGGSMCGEGGGSLTLGSISAFPNC